MLVFRSCILFSIIVLCGTDSIKAIFGQHCGYWWPGSLSCGSNYLWVNHFNAKFFWEHINICQHCDISRHWAGVDNHLSPWEMRICLSSLVSIIPDSKVHGANMGPIWGRQDPGGPHVGPMNFAIWDHGWCWLGKEGARASAAMILTCCMK